MAYQCFLVSMAYHSELVRIGPSCAPGSASSSDSDQSHVSMQAEARNPCQKAEGNAQTYYIYHNDMKLLQDEQGIHDHIAEIY